MRKKLKSRLWALCAAGIGMLALAAAPQPARRAQPARPVQQTGAGRLSGRAILVDAGHGGTDGGARARSSGVWEKEINLQTALAVGRALEKEGARVILTRDTDMEYHRNKRRDLTARLEKAKREGADILLSIHMNEYRSRKESGPQVFFRAGREESRLLAGCVQEAMIRVLRPAKERRAMAGDYYILSLDIPSVLVECGFLSHPEEEKLLLTEAYREKIAQAVTEGVREFFDLFEHGQNAGFVP